MTQDVYSIEEAAEILGCGAETAVERITSGDLPGVKIGRGWIIPREAFIRRLNEMALEEAQHRRADRHANTRAAVVIQYAKSTRTRRIPPVLPSGV